MSEDLLIIGAGRLGQALAKRWHLRFPEATITAETRGSEGPALAAVHWRKRSDPAPAPSPYVIFAVPPSATDDYSAEARRAFSLWNGSGAAVFISSTAVYREDEGGWVAESSPVAEHDRARRLLAAEREFAAGGTIVRLAGLYSKTRGPHLAYRERPPTEDAWLNLIEEDDAARLAFRVLEVAARGQLYLGCDSCPLTRRELWEISNEGTPAPFPTPAAMAGRRCNNGRTRETLGWEPRYRRFADWWALTTTT